jgi:CubicO group peptidase (beta-lactamase class C family)
MIPEDMLQSIKDMCKGKENIKVTVAVMQDGQIEKKLFGCDGVELPYQSYHYEIGSITKTFTAAIVAKAVTSGKLSLEDRIDQFLPELDKTKHHPTIKNLVTHTSGYPSDSPEFDEAFAKAETDNMYNQYTYDNIINIIKEIELEDKVYDAKYSNFGSGVLAMVLEKALGKSIHVMMQELLDDWKMNETFLGTMHSDRMDIQGFNEDNEPLGNLLWNQECMVGPAGYLYATAEDLFSYAKLQMDESMEYLQLCHQTLAPYQRGEGAPFDIGINWMLIPDFNIIFHNGGTKGFHTILCMNKPCKTAIIMLCNYMIEEVTNVALYGLINLTRDKNLSQ